jgi:flagellar capping protein FliD
LAGTQAAEISRYELEQSVKNMFNGADDGVHGLADLGINVASGSGRLSLDSAKLDAMLASNRHGAVDALQEFSANFAKSASLLNAKNNFIPNQLGNLDRAIHYIADNNAAWRTEFGTGNAAKPTGQTAKALAAYQQSYGA